MRVSAGHMRHESWCSYFFFIFLISPSARDAFEDSRENVWCHLSAGHELHEQTGRKRVRRLQQRHVSAGRVIVSATTKFEVAVALKFLGLYNVSSHGVPALCVPVSSQSASPETETLPSGTT